MFLFKRNCRLQWQYVVRFVCKICNFVRQHYAGLQIMRTLLFECFDILHKKMLRDGIIEPSTFPWRAQALVVNNSIIRNTY